MQKAGEMYVQMANEMVILEPHLKFGKLLKALREKDFDVIDECTGLGEWLTVGFQTLGESFVVSPEYIKYVFYGGPKVSFLAANSKTALDLKLYAEAFCKMMRAMHIHWVSMNGDRIYTECVASDEIMANTTLVNPCWQLVPFELLGWKHVEMRYPCLIRPILRDILLSHWKNVNFQSAYERMAREFAAEYKLTDKKAVKRCLREGNEFYQMWPEALDKALTDVTSSKMARLLTEFTTLPSDVS